MVVLITSVRAVFVQSQNSKIIFISRHNIIKSTGELHVFYKTAISNQNSHKMITQNY